MAFIYPLCSSSKGNCTYVGTYEEGVLIDAGVGIRNFASHLNMIGLKKSAIKGIFVTHEHSDHVKGLGRIQSELQVPVYASSGTLTSLLHKNLLASTVPVKVIDCRPEQLGGMEITAIKTPHDSAESQAYRVSSADYKRITVCTDLGFVSEEIHNQLKDSDILMLESNYEENLLKIGIYPPFLKRRIAGKRGHLSNADCAGEICRLFDLGLKNFLLGHLSEENNRPELAYSNVVSELEQKGARIDEDYSLFVAPRTNAGTLIEAK